MSSRGRYNRYVQFQTPTDANTEGSLSRTWANTFTSYALKADEQSNTGEEAGRRTTLSRNTWHFPYNESIVRDGRFWETNATSKIYYVVGVSEMEYQTDMVVEAELRV